MTSYPYVYANEQLDDCLGRIKDYGENDDEKENTGDWSSMYGYALWYRCICRIPLSAYLCRTAGGCVWSGCPADPKLR